MRVLLLLALPLLAAEDAYDVPGWLVQLKSPLAAERVKACEKLKGGSALSYAAAELSSRDGAASSYALEKLSKMERPGLAAAVKACDESRDCAALKKLGEEEKQAVADGLLFALSDPDSGVRGAALSAIYIAGPGARPQETFLRGWRNTPAERKKDYLGMMKGANGRQALILALSDADAAVRRQAAEVLGEMKAQDAVPALEDAAQDSDAGVRAAARDALASIAAPAGTGSATPPPSSGRRARSPRRP